MLPPLSFPLLLSNLLCCIEARLVPAAVHLYFPVSRNNTITRALDRFFLWRFTLDATFHLFQRIDQRSSRADGCFAPKYNSRYPIPPAFILQHFGTLNCVLFFGFVCVHLLVGELYC